MPIMSVICCVCGIKYSEKECSEEMSKVDSHGYCPGCFQDVLKEIDEEFKKNDRV